LNYTEPTPGQAWWTEIRENVRGEGDDLIRAITLAYDIYLLHEEKKEGTLFVVVVVVVNISYPYIIITWDLKERAANWVYITFKLQHIKTISIYIKAFHTCVCVFSGLLC
jgi:hypothetical protein